MTLMVNIPETQYNNIVAVKNISLGRMPYKGIIMNAIRAIQNGTPIPNNTADNKWTPLTKRPMTEEEKESYKEILDYCDDAEIFTSPLPDDEQEVLITVFGHVTIDTFEKDSMDGCSFEGYDIDDITAWMPLPEPYKEEDTK